MELIKALNYWTHDFSWYYEKNLPSNMQSTKERLVYSTNFACCVMQQYEKLCSCRKNVCKKYLVTNELIFLYLFPHVVNKLFDFCFILV